MMVFKPKIKKIKMCDNCKSKAIKNNGILRKELCEKCERNLEEKLDIEAIRYYMKQPYEKEFEKGGKK